MSTDILTLPRRREPARALPRIVVATTVARRASRSGAGGGGVYGVYVLASAKGFASQFPTSASRQQFAESLGSNTGLAALLGPARQIDTVAGFTAWRCLGVLTLVGAVWGLLAATRLLRGEEDAGRWELLLSGQTTRSHAAVQGLLGLAVGWVALWAVTAVITVSAGRSVDPLFATGPALFLATAMATSAALFPWQVSWPGHGDRQPASLPGPWASCSCCAWSPTPDRGWGGCAG